MEETVGERINEKRSESAIRTGAKTIAVACPFCMTMFEDGMKAKGEEENIRVADIS
jgi:Fe-S oxidoreductase